MNDKGSSLLDLILIVAVLFGVVVGGLVLHNVFSQADEQIQASTLGDDAKAFNQTQNNRFPSLLDNMFFVVFAGLSIALFIGAFFLQSHPVFFIFSVIILAFIVIVAAVIGNAYEDFVGNEEFSSIEANYNVIPFVFNNFVTIIAVLGILLIIGLFAKTRGEAF